VGSWALLLALGLVILGGWLAWACLARVSVYAESVAARVEVAQGASPVAATVSGRVIESHLDIGAEIARGEILVVLEDDEARFRLVESAAALAGLAPQLAARQRELGSEERAAELDSEQGSLAVSEARARADEAEVAARHAEDDLARARKLSAGFSVSESEVAALQSDARRLRLAANAGRIAASRVAHDVRRARADRQVRIAQTSTAILALQSQVLAVTATIQRLEYERARHTVRAAVAGRVVEAAELPDGLLVHEGDRLGAIVPAGALRLVADFAPAEALGRVRSGQRARLRLDGFPWMQYGSIAATVERVSSEPRAGLVRVELSVGLGGFHLEHGWTGRVDVEVERLSPAAVLLRAAGLRVAGVEAR